MIKKYFKFWQYSNSILLMVKLPFCFILNKLGQKYQKKNFVKIATNILCKRPYILRTPFGNYLATTLFHYFCIVDNYEPKISELINRISKNIKDAYLINIGSNIGRWSIGLTKQYGYKTLSFEPGPSTYHNQKTNIILSGLDEEIELFNYGLGNTNGTLDFLIGDDCDTDAHFAEVNSMVNCKKNWKTIKVPVKKFDDLLIEKSKIDKTRLVIIDVEGFELQVLKGMEKTLKSFHDISIIVEIWENHNDKEKTLSYMKDLGYRYEKIDDSDYLFSK